MSNEVLVFHEGHDFYDMMSGMGNKGVVFGYILKKFNEDNIFNFSTFYRKKMIDEIGLSEGVIRAAIREFVKSGLMARVGGPDYMVNPRLFYRGFFTRANKRRMTELFDKFSGEKVEF